MFTVIHTSHISLLSRNSKTPPKKNWWDFCEKLRKSGSNCFVVFFFFCFFQRCYVFSVLVVVVGVLIVVCCFYGFSIQKNETNPHSFAIYAKFAIKVVEKLAQLFLLLLLLFRKTTLHWEKWARFPIPREVGRWRCIVCIHQGNGVCVYNCGPFPKCSSSSSSSASWWPFVNVVQRKASPLPLKPAPKK